MNIPTIVLKTTSNRKISRRL